MRSEPPLLLIAAGRRPRARRAPKMRVRELALHTAAVDVLKKLARPGWMWAHYPSGEARDARTGAKLKKMGAKRGWPDLMLISPGGAFHGLELKAQDGELTEDQEDFQRWAITHGVAYSVARSVDEVLAIFGAWECLLPIGGAR